MKTSTESFSIFNPVAFTVLVILLAISIGLHLLGYIGVPVMVALIVISLLIASSIQIADQWEKAVILRMGKYNGLKGPGLFFIIPVIDRISSYIDQRVRVTEFRAEQTLTKDTVPVNVDAVVYWTVWDVEKAALEVQEYIRAISYIAQTDLRDIIGKHELADLRRTGEGHHVGIGILRIGIKTH
jgi:regulator of protease activity HflC (stomatin/prohibitin superfamily)